MKKHLRVAFSIALVGLTCLPGFSQKRPQDRFREFLKQQWLIGLDVGSNLTQAIPIERYTGIASLDGGEMYEKDYNDFANPGIQAGLYITYYFKGLSIATQPSFRRVKFSYQNEYSWGDSPPEQTSFFYDINQQVDFFHLPLIVKYDLLKKKIKPFLAVGIYQNFLMSATKEVNLDREDYGTGEANVISAGTVFIGVDDAFQPSHTGLMGGAGIAYDTDSNVRMVFELTYRESINNIINPNERYTENQLTSVGNVFDDLRLRNVSASIQFLFPLKYISSQFKSQ